MSSRNTKSLPCPPNFEFLEQFFINILQKMIKTLKTQVYIIHIYFCIIIFSNIFDLHYLTSLLCDCHQLFLVLQRNKFKNIFVLQNPNFTIFGTLPSIDFEMYCFEPGVRPDGPGMVRVLPNRPRLTYPQEFLAPRDLDITYCSTTVLLQTRMRELEKFCFPVI